MLTTLNKNKKKGFLLAEALIVSGIIAVVLGSFVFAAFISLRLSSETKKAFSASQLAQEMMESVRGFRNNAVWNSSLGSLAEATPYHLEEVASGVLSAVAGEESVGGFNRKFQTENVSRYQGAIEPVYNPLRNDPDTKKIRVTVTWESGEYILETYLTNWK